jgi:hypothetical protein
MKKETIDNSAQWESLHQIASLYLSNNQQHMDVVQEFDIELFELAYKVGVVNGFDWMSWTEPAPSLEAIQTFNRTITKRHITRILCAEKFSWGTYDENIKNKILPALCVHLCELHIGEIKHSSSS